MADLNDTVVLSDNLKSPVAKQRDFRIDIIKGIAIFMMVLGHSGAPAFLHDWVYMFHMAVFFMASGYFFKPERFDCAKSLWSYVWKKIKTLYIPYVLANVFFRTCNNLFVSLCILPASELKTVTEIIIDILKSFALISEKYMGGALWFVKCLFLILIICAVFEYLIKNAKNKNLFRIILIVLVGIVAELIQFLTLNQKLPQSLCSIPAGIAVFYVGYYINKYKDKLSFSLPINIIVFVVATALTIVAVLLIGKSIGPVVFAEIQLGAGEIVEFVYFMILSVCGWIMIYGIATVINKYVSFLKSAIAYIGRHTLSVVIWHYLSFKIASLIWIVANGLDITMLSRFPIINPTAWYYFMVYTFFGLCVPLLFAFIYGLIKKNVITKKQ